MKQTYADFNLCSYLLGELVSDELSHQLQSCQPLFTNATFDQPQVWIPKNMNRHELNTIQMIRFSCTNNYNYLCTLCNVCMYAKYVYMK